MRIVLTIAVVILLLVAAYVVLSAGPWSFAHAYAEDAAKTLRRSQLQRDVVTEADLEHVPAPVQRGTGGSPLSRVPRLCPPVQETDHRGTTLLGQHAPVAVPFRPRRDTVDR